APLRPGRAHQGRRVPDPLARPGQAGTPGQPRQQRAPQASRAPLRVRGGGKRTAWHLRGGLMIVQGKWARRGFVVVVLGGVLRAGFLSRWWRPNESPPPPPLAPWPFAVAPGVYLLGETYPAAVYAVDTSDGLVLIDSGIEANAALVTRQLYSLGLD